MSVSDASNKIEAISAERAKQILNQPAKTIIKWSTFEFGLRFISPVMLDRMTDAQVLGLLTGQAPPDPKDEPLTRKCIRKMYSDQYDAEEMPIGAIGIPAVILYAAWRDAGETVKWGSGKNDRITLATKGTELYHMIRLHKAFFPIINLQTGEPYRAESLLDDEGRPVGWAVDLRKGNPSQNKGKGGAVAIIRGRFDEGGLVGHLDINIDRLSPAKAFELLCIGGVKQGLVAGRPAKKLPYGQYAVTHWEWVGGVDPKEHRTVHASTGTVKRRRKNSDLDATDSNSEEVDI